MNVLMVDNVNEALPWAMAILAQFGEPCDTRAGPVLRIPLAVSTVYQHPQERVLFDPIRDANPFFHFFEALWILEGRDDVKFLAGFNKRMPSFSDDGTTYHGAYGARLRSGHDQVASVIHMLKQDPSTRRAVLQLWQPAKDLGSSSLDVPCNVTAAFRTDAYDKTLHLTVFNRSNDVVWGAYGTNVVQFSMLLEYVAARAGLRVGTYTQISNDFHVYIDNPYWQFYIKEYGSMGRRPAYDPYADGNVVEQLMYEHQHTVDPISVQPYALFASPDFDEDLENFFHLYDADEQCRASTYPLTDAFAYVVEPMYSAWMAYKRDDIHAALNIINSACVAEDWALACRLWLLRRLAKREAA